MPDPGNAEGACVVGHARQRIAVAGGVAVRERTGDIERAGGDG